MMMNRVKRAVDYDVVVIGGGHAGVEAALAVSRMGRSAALVTMEASKLALMSCNPAIGGIGKSHLVKEIDALGGVMGEAIDATGIQFRTLNKSKGAAVWSTRAQADRIGYNDYIVQRVSADSRIEVIEALAGAILVEDGCCAGIRTEDGNAITSRAVVVATGTFLGGLIHIGEKKIRAGRLGESAAYRLSESFDELGFELGRLKTGTPARVDGSTIDWSVCEIQPGDDPIPYFSHRSNRAPFEQTPCHLTYTTAATREIVSENFHRSPIFSGQIDSTGPRYCPSIEDKFYRFKDKPRHQIFLEPEGNGTDEVYPNGLSTSLPEEVQDRFLRTIIGLEDVRIVKYGYAVEYDYCPAYQIKPNLETRRVPGLFFAGQINGTSGYEEAAAQGLIAGVNAVCRITGDAPLVLDRSQAYIGVMIDDLTTRSTTEPYRMFTSRAEYRLALREDNARDRLSHLAARHRLISRDEHEQFEELEAATLSEVKLLESTRVQISSLGELGKKFKRDDAISLAQVLKQPGVRVKDVLPLIGQTLEEYSHRPGILERAAIRIQYAGYIDKQAREIEKFRRLEAQQIPESFDFKTVTGLKAEAAEKFSRFRPTSIGQASRIEGVTPGDVAVLSVWVKRHLSRAS